MLPRKPTRIELKPEDKEEYEKLKKAEGQREKYFYDTPGSRGAQEGQPAVSTAARIGLHQ